MGGLWTWPVSGLRGVGQLRRQLQHVRVDSGGRVLRGQVDACCTVGGIEVSATPDVDDEAAADMLERLEHWRMTQAKRAKWERQGWKRPDGLPGPEVLWSTMTVRFADEGLEGP